jgi:hypothetical protein
MALPAATGRPRPPALRPARFVAGGALALASGLHAVAAPGHLQEGVAISVFFGAVAAGQLAAAIAILRRPAVAVVDCVAGTTLALMLLWALSRTVGFPFGGHGEREAIGVVDSLCLAAQAVAVGALAVAARVHRRALTVAAAAVCFLALVAAGGILAEGASDADAPPPTVLDMGDSHG